LATSAERICHKVKNFARDMIFRHVANFNGAGNPEARRNPAETASRSIAFSGI
jgi:hypothetical protein